MPWTPEFNGIFFIFVAFLRQKKKCFSKLTPIHSDQNQWGRIHDNIYFVLGMRQIQKIPLNSGVQGMSNQ